MSAASVLDGLVQPDARSCGASCLVAVDALADPTYAARLRAEPDFWAAEVLGAHASVTGLRDGGRLAPPWPRAWGTPPWAVARRLRATTRLRWRVRRVSPAGLRLAVAESAVPLYVGTRLLPRHVLLVTTTAPDGTLAVYDPARGSVRVLTEVLRTDWPVVWWAVLPSAAQPDGARRAGRHPTPR